MPNVSGELPKPRVGSRLQDSQPLVQAQLCSSLYKTALQLQLETGLPLAPVLWQQQAETVQIYTSLSPASRCTRLHLKWSSVDFKRRAPRVQPAYCTSGPRVRRVQRKGGDERRKRRVRVPDATLPGAAVRSDLLLAARDEPAQLQLSP